MDTTELEAAYAAFLDAARQPAPAGEDDWTPERVLAHIAVNDELLLAATSAVYAGTVTSYDNAHAIDQGHLAYVESNAGSYEVLLSAVRRGGEELVEVARRLTDEMAATVVPTRIVDGDELRVDAEVPWGDVLLTHARVHLPAHARQLSGA